MTSVVVVAELFAVSIHVFRPNAYLLGLLACGDVLRVGVYLAVDLCFEVLECECCLNTGQIQRTTYMIRTSSS